MKKSLYWKHLTLPMKIERYEMNVTKRDIDNSRIELEYYIETQSDGNSKTWGYFPELSPCPTEYPETVTLVEKFTSTVIQHDPFLLTIPLTLAFVRRAISEPRSDFGGFHVDANAGISHVWPDEVSHDKDVYRMLFNIGDKPRRLEFYPYTLEQLREHGIQIPRDHYEILQLPAELPLESIEIPALESDTVYGLSFISTKVPHAGKTSGEGHFLISYGAYVDETEIISAFPK